jgi:predicted nucleotide-binding protein
MDDLIINKLNSFIEETNKNTAATKRENWKRKVLAFIKTALGPEDQIKISVANESSDYAQSIISGHLQGVVAKAQLEKNNAAKLSNQIMTSADLRDKNEINSKKVFVVHGKDNDAKETTARFLEKLGLQPIILHEQPNGGRTIIEKFEVYSGDVAFAVVLLTPDDVAYIAENPSELKSRARQNVILELGYFMGKLGRNRVCALYKGAIDLPSDYQGVIYTEMDKAGAWKTKLSQEIVQAHVSIDLTGLLKI